MASQRPRRALRPPLALRLARFTVPALVAGSLVAGVTATAWPQSDQLTAVPAASSSAPADNFLRTEPNQVSRNGDRPTASASDAAQAAADSKAAKQRAAAKAKKVAAAKAAKKAAEKRAEKRADARRARAREDAEQEAAARLAHARAKAAAEREKAAAERKLDLDVVGSRYTTAALNVRTQADEDAKVTTVLERRSKVSITDTITDGFRLIVRDGKGRWVKNKYLAKKRPKAESSSSRGSSRVSSGGSSGGSSGISSKSCSKSSSIEGGLQPDGVRVYRALCARFPNITSFGGRRNANGGFHPSGRAVDAMISNGGWEVARWVRANAKRLGVSEVIHAQSIWTVQRSGEGWRGMSDMGNATANHFDHVHVSVYGNSGG